MNKYPIYVISKGRHDIGGHTGSFLIKDGIPFNLVVEPQETDKYKERFGDDRVLTLPFSNLGLGGIPARNWVWEHAKSLGHKRHWILDDNIRETYKLKNGKRVRCDSNEAFEKSEEFLDKFSNIAILGLNCINFAHVPLPPFNLNTRAYSCLNILNELPFRWRGRYNEDTDLCLQALTNNWCTVNVNAYLIDKKCTMKTKGGNMEELYKGNGRLKMARSLELAWHSYPGLVKTSYKWNRPQHQVKWKIFKTALKQIEKNG